MKKFIQMLIITVLLMQMVACGDTTTKETSKDDPPMVYANTDNGKQIELVKFGYSWDYGDRQVESDSIAPNDYKKYETDNTITVTNGTVLTLSNSKDKIEKGYEEISSYTLWGPNGEVYDGTLVERTNSLLKIEKDTGGNGILMIGMEASGEYIFGITLRYERGTVHYGFKVIVEGIKPVIGGKEAKTSQTGSETMDYKAFLKLLKQNGFTYKKESTGSKKDSFSSVGCINLRVGKTRGFDKNGIATFTIYEYDSIKAMNNDVKYIGKDGSSFTTPGKGGVVEWVDFCHFFKSGRIIVQYLGINRYHIDFMNKNFGKQFAGMDYNKIMDDGDLSPFTADDAINKALETYPDFPKHEFPFKAWKITSSENCGGPAPGVDVTAIYKSKAKEKEKGRYVVSLTKTWKMKSYNGVKNPTAYWKFAVTSDSVELIKKDTQYFRLYMK